MKSKGRLPLTELWAVSLTGTEDNRTVYYLAEESARKCADDPPMEILKAIGEVKSSTVWRTRTNWELA